MSIGSNGNGNGHGFGRGRANMDASIGRLGDLRPELAPANPRGLPGLESSSWTLGGGPEAGPVENWPETILKYMRIGCGRASAARECGVTLATLEALIQNDRAYRARVETIEGGMVDDCMSVILDDALSGRSVPSAVAYAKLTNDRKATEEAAKRLEPSPSREDDRTIGFRLANLTDPEVHAFGDYLEAIAAGAEFTAEDALTFIALFKKVARPPQTPPSLDES